MLVLVASRSLIVLVVLAYLHHSARSVGIDGRKAVADGFPLRNIVNFGLQRGTRWMSVLDDRPNLLASVS